MIFITVYIAIALSVGSLVYMLYTDDNDAALVASWVGVLWPILVITYIAIFISNLCGYREKDDNDLEY